MLSCYYRWGWCICLGKLINGTKRKGLSCEWVHTAQFKFVQAKCTEKGIDGLNIRMSAVVMNRIRVVSVFSLIIWFFSNIEDIFVNCKKLFFKGKNKTGDFHSLPPRKQLYIWSKMKSPKWNLLTVFTHYYALSPSRTKAWAVSLFSEVASLTAEPVLVV